MSDSMQEMLHAVVDVLATRIAEEDAYEGHAVGVYLLWTPAFTCIRLGDFVLWDDEDDHHEGDANFSYENILAHCEMRIANLVEALKVLIPEDALIHEQARRSAKEIRDDDQP